MADQLVGTTLLGKLRVVRRVGEGAFGEVFEVEHTLTGHRRALKILRRDRATDLEAVTRFVREARVTSRLVSPHVAEVHDAGRLPDGRAYAVMDWLDGRSLRAILEAEGRLAPARAVKLARQAAAGLATVHAAGLLHRDLKPENLFVEESEDRELLKLLDFGLVRDDAGVADALTREGAVLGSPAYMSARRLAGEPATARDDVHALGVILYELVAGRRPFEGATVAALIAATHRGDYPSLASLGVETAAGLPRVIDRALGRADPITTAEALERALATLESSRDGDRIDAYTIVRAISRGGMGEIYEVARGDGERLAMKVLRKDRLRDDKAVARMRKEATLAGRVAGDDVLPVVDQGTDPITGAPYLVMELLEGEDLGAMLSRGPLDPKRALEILGALSRALDAVHEAGLVHRDVKPENVFVVACTPDAQDARREGASIKLLDFGIAALVEPTVDETGTTTTSAVIGTPLYLAPEQVDHARSVGPAADRFALAQLAYTLLVGVPYFQAEASRGLLAIVSALAQGRLEPPSLRARRQDRELAPGFDAWFARATASRPDARFGSCREQIEALTGVVAASPPRRPPGRTWIAIALTLLALGVAGWIGAKESAVELPRPDPAIADDEAGTLAPSPTGSPATSAPEPALIAVPSASQPAASAVPAAPITSPSTPSVLQPGRPRPPGQTAPPPIPPASRPDEAHETLF